MPRPGKLLWIRRRSACSSSQRRHTGSGEFAGVLVSLLALFALASTGGATTRHIPKRAARWLGFGVWRRFSPGGGLGALFVSLRVALQAAYFSTIRNPMKFMHPFHLAWIILAGFGLEALWRGHLQSAAPAAPGGVKKPFTAFEKGWMGGLFLVAAAAGLAFGFMARAMAARPAVAAAPDRHIRYQGFPGEWGARMAAFAIGGSGLVCVFLGCRPGRWSAS